MNPFFDWLDQLHPRLQHIIQDQLNTNFVHYSLKLASEAKENSRLMAKHGGLGHLYLMGILSHYFAEVVSSARLQDFGWDSDESGLQSIVNRWKNSEEHRRLLIDHNTLGIGLYWEPSENTLYATVRLANL